MTEGMQQSNPKLMSTYWLCDDCATKRGLESFKTGNSVIIGLCGNCDSREEQKLTPVVDLRKKREVGNGK